MASPAEIAKLTVRLADEELHRAVIRYVARAEAAGLLNTHPTLVAAALVKRLWQRATRARTLLRTLLRALEAEAGYAELVAQAGDVDAFEAEVARERATLELVRRREP